MGWGSWVQACCYGLNFCPLSKKKIHVETWIPNVMVLGGGAFGAWLGQGRSPINGTHQDGMRSQQHATGQRCLPQPDHAAPISALQPPEQWAMHFCCFGCQAVVLCPISPNWLRHLQRSVRSWMSVVRLHLRPLFVPFYIFFSLIGPCNLISKGQCSSFSDASGKTQHRAEPRVGYQWITL